MTETGKNEETTDLPLEGSPNRNSTGASAGSHEDDKSDTEGTTPNPAMVLLKTPTSNRKSDAGIFKTPEPLTPTSSAKKRKRLTPEEKSLREKERQDKRRKLEEEKQKKEQEKLEKAKQKEEERLRKEEEKKRLEEEKRLERLKKEEERLKKEEERLKKEEERKKLEEERKQERLKKEEEKKRKEDERKQKEDERKQKEEEKERERMKLEEKKTKQAQFFSQFFKKSSTPKVHTIENGSVRVAQPKDKEQAEGDSVGAETKKLFNPLPFQIKTDMAVAPLCRRTLSEGERNILDLCFREPSTCSDAQLNSSSAYLMSIKKGKGRNYGRTEIILRESPEIQVLDEEEARNSKPIGGCLKWRMKLLQFEENRRPAYWGTWKRKAVKVTPRRPFIKEKEVDYDFDSDDEWEDEPEDGEEIENSGGEGEDPEDGDGDEEEEGWMVPHGYLSDSERDGGKLEDFESLKCKEKEFYKSLKEKSLIGYPVIMTSNLSCFKMRYCPVFRSANVAPAKRKPRAPRKKPEAKTPAPPPPAPQPVAVVAPVIEQKTPPKQQTNQRKSQRKRKILEEKPNPYAKPPSGFLGMELPSDDEDDMDWDDMEKRLSESESQSGSEADDDEDMDSSDSNDDLFIPIVTSKSKK